MSQLEWRSSYRIHFPSCAICGCSYPLEDLIANRALSITEPRGHRTIHRTTARISWATKGGELRACRDQIFPLIGVALGWQLRRRRTVGGGGSMRRIWSDQRSWLERRIESSRLALGPSILKHRRDIRPSSLEISQPIGARWDIPWPSWHSWSRRLSSLHWRRSWWTWRCAIWEGDINWRAWHSRRSWLNSLLHWRSIWQHPRSSRLWQPPTQLLQRLQIWNWWDTRSRRLHLAPLLAPA